MTDNAPMKLDDFEWDKGHVGHVTHNVQNLTNVKTMLDSTGSGFCLAKWKQVTMHLGTGLTHSCHHPRTHKIPLEEIAVNPSALHNTNFKKEQRKAMLRGEKPAECDYCWRVENVGEFSDRHSKSIEPWALPYHDEVAALTGDENVYPSYLEVSFSNVCNLKCTYCGPEASSMWVEELKAHGPVKLLDGTKDVQWAQGWQDLDTLSYKNREFNPYVDAFWKWFPEAYKHLKVYRITGGEPLLSKETFRSMDWFIENPNPELEFNINTNLSVPEKIWQKFVDKLQTMLAQNSVKKVTIFTSVEGWAEQATYARTNLDFELFKSRYEQLCAMTNVRSVIMSTYNIFSVTSFRKVLEWQLDLKRRYNPSNVMAHIETNSGVPLDSNYPYVQRKIDNTAHTWVVGIDIPYLRSPAFLDVQLLTSSARQYILDDFMFMMRNVPIPSTIDHQGFEEYEMEKFKRIVMHCIHFKPDPKQIALGRAKFYDFVNEMDIRRGTNFLETFPLLAGFYANCKATKERVANGDYTITDD